MSVIFRNAYVGLSTSTGEATYDISGSVSSVRLERKFDIIDITRQPDTAYRRAIDLEDWSITLRTLQSFSNQPRESGVDMDHLFAAVSSATQAGGSCSISLRPNRDLPRSATNPEYRGQCLIETYNPLDGEVGDLLITDVELIGTGDLIRMLDAPDDAHPLEILTIRISEVIRLGTIGIVGDDLTSISISERLVLVIDGVHIFRIFDAIAPQATESRPTVATSMSVIETVSPHLTDTAIAARDQVSLATTDTIAIHIAEVARMGLVLITTDIIAVRATDVADSLIYANIAHVQSSGTTGAGNTVSLAYTSNNTAASLLIARLAGAPMTVASITDTRGNTWTRINGASGGTSDKIELWYAMNAAAGANTVTPSVSGAPVYWEFDIFEYSGVATASALGQATLQEQAGPPTTTDGVSSGLVTTTTIRELVFANTLRVGGSGVSTAVGTGFTLRQNIFGDSGCEDTIKIVPGSIAGTFTSDASDNVFVTSIATFKALVS